MNVQGSNCDRKKPFQSQSCAEFEWMDILTKILLAYIIEENIFFGGLINPFLNLLRLKTWLYRSSSYLLSLFSCC